jgi:hypothetical protein
LPSHAATNRSLRRLMRESAYRDGRWFDLHLMSMLESEYN